MLKRKLDCIDDTFISDCEKKFDSDPLNKIAKNAINSMGSMFSTMNSERVNEISHLFLNSVKKKHVRATNQGASGRCWMFAGLNIFRHLMINCLDLEQFEFSEVYLFFWDKFERANSYIKWFIENPQQKPGDKPYEYMLTNYMSDGGWWNTFSNLVEKYGLIPQSAMKETYQSDDSEEMNKIIKERLDYCINIMRTRRDKMSADDLENLRKETLNYIYDILVKFLGKPPKSFSWHLAQECDDGGNSIITKLTPQKFYNLINEEIDINSDFVVLSNIPMKEFKYYTNYRILNTNNVCEGKLCNIFNVPINEMVRYAIKSLSSGVAVWFAADVNKCFNWYHSCLDDKLFDNKDIFGNIEKFDKGDRLLMHDIESNHAMALTGFNLDDRGRPTNWQVENSWGYCDRDTPGLDGYLNMSHSWFEKYVIQIVVYKKFLSRTLQTKLNSEPIEINPWDSVAPALQVRGVKIPEKYLSTMSRKI
jgi:bleomycin hydrolase